MTITSINTLSDALAAAASSLHRVYAARDDDKVIGFVVVSVQLDPTIGVQVTPLAAIGESYDILRNTPLEVLELYCKIKRGLRGWDGEFETYPLPPSDDDDMQAYYQLFDEA